MSRSNDVKPEPTADEIERVADALQTTVRGFTTWEDAARAATLAMDRRASPPDNRWLDPLESPQAEAIRNGKLDMTEILSLFDRMERELVQHRLAAASPAASEVEKAVKVCPQCDGEGSYADGLDEAACSTNCTRCGGNGWIVDLNALRASPPAPAVAVPEGSRDWPEDFRYEDGHCPCQCNECGQRFFGNKLRATCKVCAAPEPPATRSYAEGIEAARPIDEWHEDYGHVVWWSMDPETNDWRGEAAFIGSPLGSDWPDPEYHTHWTPHPDFPPAPAIRSLAQESRDDR